MKNIALLFCIILSNSSRAQVPVSKEPRHHVVLDNGEIRVLNVLIPPGDTTQYHLHTTPSVFINFTKTTTGSQVLNGQPSTGTSAPGTIYFENLAAPHNRIHRVWNVDTAAFHVMDIELLSKDTGFAQQPLALTYSALLINNPWVRAYKLHLGNAQLAAVNQRQSACILVAINDAAVHIVQNGTEKATTVKAGDLFWIEPGGHFSIINTGNTVKDFALLEVK